MAAGIKDPVIRACSTSRMPRGEELTRRSARGCLGSINACKKLRGLRFPFLSWGYAASLPTKYGHYTSSLPSSPSSKVSCHNRRTKEMTIVIRSRRKRIALRQPSRSRRRRESEHDASHHDARRREDRWWVTRSFAGLLPLRRQLTPQKDGAGPTARPRRAAVGANQPQVGLLTQAATDR